MVQKPAKKSLKFSIILLKGVWNKRIQGYCFPFLTRSLNFFIFFCSFKNKLKINLFRPQPGNIRNRIRARPNVPSHKQVIIFIIMNLSILLEMPLGALVVMWGLRFLSGFMNLRRIYKKLHLKEEPYRFIFRLFLESYLIKAI